MVRINFHSNWDDVLSELDRLEGLPDEAAVARLDAVLTAGFLATKAITHVITGSLKNSGRESTSVHGHTWEGSITYGGPSPGFPHDPVKYAYYEQRRRGSHDFMAPVYELHEALREAVREGLQGEA